MRFLADENFPGDAVRALRRNGFEVAWVSEDSAGVSDRTILGRCEAEDRVLLTLDKDFGDLVFRGGFALPPGIVLFRMNTESPSEFAIMAMDALRSNHEWKGFFSVVTQDRIRMRPFPKRPH
jgi:predicted nuclease of predicted toxin-antitoxin system